MLWVSEFIFLMLVSIALHNYIKMCLSYLFLSNNIFFLSERQYMLTIESYRIQMRKEENSIHNSIL